MTNRFIVPKWLKEHLFEYSSIEDIPKNQLEKIKTNLAKFSNLNPEVSIVMPVWNEEQNIIKTLSSISQNKSNYKCELIIINNKSTDNTQKILDYFNIHTIQENKQGISFARQTGLENAKGKFHLCVDGDTLYPPNWIDAMVEPLKEKKITCVCAKHSFIPINSSHVILGLYELAAEFLFAIRNRHRKYLNVLGFNFGFRTEDAKKAGGFNISRPRWSDGWMAMSLMESGEIYIIKSETARTWTSARRLLADGSLTKAFMKRIKKEITRIKEYVTNPQIKK